MSRSNPDKNVLVIFAPTASGKTALMRELFSPCGSHFILNAEVVSADSMQVYRGMDIGTAKPDTEFCAQLPHHLVDVADPGSQFSVADFVTAADLACRDILSRGRLPVVCGGTGFYIRSFLYGLPKTPEGSPAVRAQLRARLETEGNRALYAELCALDERSAAKIHVNDSYRLLRALEVFYTTGRRRSEFTLENSERSDFDFTFIVLEPPRELLFKRIEERVARMLDAGLEDEFKALVAAGCTEESPGMRAIGYREWFHASGREEAEALIVRNSCRYAKKQFTYIRDIPGSLCLPYDGSEAAVERVEALVRQAIGAAPQAATATEPAGAGGVRRLERERNGGIERFFGMPDQAAQKMPPSE